MLKEGKDTLYAVPERKGKTTSLKKKEANDNESDSDLQNIKKALALLTTTVQKKYYKKPSSISRRYSSGNKHNEQKDKFEGKKRFEGKKPDGTSKDDKDGDEPIKCSNCGKLGHFARDFRKPVVRNSDYYKNKMLLAKQKEARKALMAEDDHWLQLSDEEEDAHAHLCFMGNHSEDDNSDDDDRGSNDSSSSEGSTIGTRVERQDFNSKVFNFSLCVL